MALCGRGVGAMLVVGLACGLADGQTTQPSTSEIDACGTLVQGTHCVLFEGGGGKYYIPDYGRYRVGDAVRVVGTVDTNCITICSDADGCIRGAALYDPAIYPCGTAIPNFPGDIVTNACTTVSGGLGSLAVVGMWLTRGRRR